MPPNSMLLRDEEKEGSPSADSRVKSIRYRGKGAEKGHDRKSVASFLFVSSAAENSCEPLCSRRWLSGRGKNASKLVIQHRNDNSKGSIVAIMVGVMGCSDSLLDWF